MAGSFAEVEPQLQDEQPATLESAARAQEEWPADLEAVSDSRAQRLAELEAASEAQEQQPAELEAVLLKPARPRASRAQVAAVPREAPPRHAALVVWGT